jgi:hypothetical protein
LVADTCRPRQIAALVSAGSMTSSMWACPAATYGSMLARSSSTMARRAAVRSSSGTAANSLRPMMLTMPSGPMTAISAVGQATM